MLKPGSKENTGLDLCANAGDPICADALPAHAADTPIASLSGKPVTAEPLFGNWQTWLADFCAQYPPAAEGDTLGTTFESFGMVVLGAILSGTGNEEEIAHVTFLPVGFVNFVLAIVQEHNLWNTFLFDDLQRALLWHRNDVKEVKLSLEALEEKLWDGCATPETVAKLIELRADRQFGGGRDTWIDAEGYDGWWIN